MAKILKIQTGTADVIVTSEFESEEAAAKDAEPTKVDAKVSEFKVENTKWKKGAIENE